MKQDKETLKTYFETGDKPTQQQFSDLIDSLNIPFIGEIKTVSFHGIPEGWARCEGQILNISEYQDLFSFIGNTYGGNGTSTFALPDLRGRIPLGAGNSTNLSNYSTGQKGGEETHVLKENEMPSHTHIAVVTDPTSGIANIEIPAFDDLGDSSDPSNTGILAKSENTVGTEMNLYSNKTPDTSLKPFTASVDSITGGSVTNLNNGENQPHNNLQPYLAINYIIALKGRIPFVNPH
ncbi:phage tail protein [Tenacibaculum sp. E3R01]|uniref:phage tail protein n=1 Tax=Tenacibaculum sp. E3R01 TaxID=2267227 RepID=UPI000DEB6C93|nr:tail fiber protein [Tenacibaculum sp. E3R01]RBW59443.1 phage tail protein [Tenacibaculum sp. E3R01]